MASFQMPSKQRIPFRMENKTLSLTGRQTSVKWVKLLLKVTYNQFDGKEIKRQTSRLCSHLYHLIFLIEVKIELASLENYPESRGGFIAT